MSNNKQGEAGRNPKEVPDAGKFNPQRKKEDVSAFSYGQHECIAKDVALAFVTGLIKLVADLKELRPAPGQMGTVKTIQVGTEKAYLNDSWSYLGFDASSKFSVLVCVVMVLMMCSLEGSLQWTWKGPV